MSRSLDLQAVARSIIDWLKKDYGLGLGHARAIDYVIRKGPKVEVRQTTGTHEMFPEL